MATKKKVKRTPAQIKAEIEKLKNELKEASALKPFEVTLKVTFTPEYCSYNDEIRSIVSSVKCPENKKIAEVIYDDVCDHEYCQSLAAAYYGDEAVDEALHASIKDEEESDD